VASGSKTSIIILSYETLACTRLCIESIRSFTAPGTYDIIVVDNASTDGSLAYLRAQPDVHLIENRENRGFPAACNQGMAAAAAESDLLLLNSDTIVTPHWLENLQRALRSDAAVGAVSCVTNQCSHFQQIPVQYEDIDAMIRFASSFNRSQPELWQPWQTLVGFCLLIRRAAYERIGGLDEAFSPGNYEDDDYCLRLRDAGYTLLLCQDTFIHHFGSASFRKDEDPRRRAAKEARYAELLARNERYLLKKHGLPADWNVLHGMVQHLPPERLAAGQRVLVVGTAGGLDLYVLAAAHPGVQLGGVTFDRRAAQRTRQDIALAFAQASPAGIAAVIEAPYDTIALLGSAPVEAEAAVDMLRGRLAPGGRVYFTDGERVFWQGEKE